MTPKDNKCGVYLCKVFGFEALDFMVLHYNNQCGWLQHTSEFMEYGIIHDGWVALDRHLQVTEVMQLLKEEDF